MQLTSFQPPELRDANNNVIQEGTYSVKNGVLANAQNTGVLDYINNNLQALQNNVVSLQSSSLVWEYVDQLPTPSEANPNSIYAVPQTDEQGNNYYIEYRLINGTWQVFGSTKVDITQAVMKSDVLDSIRADSMLPVQSKAILNALNEKPNVDDVYSKAETNTLLNNKANSSDLDNYLLKSGGTVDGNLELNPNSDMASIGLNSNKTRLYVRAGSSDGGTLCCVSKTASNYQGAVWFEANDGTKRSYLELYADGTTSAPTPDTTDNSNKIATTAYVRRNLANYLPTSGGIVNSNVIIYSTNSNQLSIRNSSDDNVSTSTPTRDIYAGVYSYDKLGNTLGNVRFLNGQSGIISELVVQNRPHDKQTQIRIGYDNNGKVFTYAPKPAVTDNSDQIATASFVKEASVTTVNLSASSTYNNDPWKVIAMNFDTLPQNKFIGGTINTGGLSCYSGFRTNGNYASFILHAYNVGKIYHVWCESGTWKYHQFTMGTATTFTV